MATKDSNPLPTKSQTTSPDTKERGSNTTVTPPKTTPSADQGLADLPVSPTKELGKKQEVLQKAQLESKSAVKEVKEKMPPSPTTCTHRYALEVWIKVETSPGNFMPLEEEWYSADFVLDTLNLTYPGCTGVFWWNLDMSLHFMAERDLSGQVIRWNRVRRHVSSYPPFPFGWVMRLR